ncbi:lipopolysaccharide biosynthesis protein [Thiorhodococcus mannitoliphagus]|uniref:Lipopolysaccharide biosynthesis protein n=1 Tax=Thiorhodococcus mannitoliphagus TaxID=329406 RepID=A0A6P1DV32_9GAMM|nr:lipopolysaccharide biosynthesis protein [Thiorhodococcus mannitoliphagus]
MEDQPQNLDDYLAILKRRKWQLILPALVLAILAILAALLIPPVYRSSATILIERQEIPSDLVRTTVTSYADQRIQVISQRVMTTSNLGELINKYDLYPDIRRKQSINAAVEKMREDVKLNMISADVLDPQSGKAQEATIAFSISFDSGSPETAQKIANDVVSLFLQENLERRAAAANEASAFLNAEADRLGQEINTLEARLAAFKEEHGDNLPELAALNRELMMRSDERLRDNAQSARTLEQQALYLESELAQLSPTLLGATGGSATSLDSYLEELQAKYVRAKERYSPSHPDRIQLEKEIAALQQQVGQSSIAAIQARLDELRAELASLKKRYSEDHPDVAAMRRSIRETETKLATARQQMRTDDVVRQDANNPAYVQLRVKLDSVRLELTSLRETRKELEHELELYEKRLTEAPRIEQEYRALTRDYENAMLKYKEIKEKGLQAELAQALERDRKSERFSLIEPPLRPEKPFKPNRLAIVVLGLVLAFAAGVGNLALQESMHRGLFGAKAVQEATRIPLLAVIPYVATDAERAAARRRVRLILGGIIAGIAVMLALVHFLIMPLDVIWFVLMRRFDAALPGLGA